MRTVVNYTQSRDYRWKASGPADAPAQALANRTGDVGEWLPTATSKGGCMALSVWWIVKNANAEDFWTWLGPPATACPQRGFGTTVDLTDSRDASRVTMGLAKAGQVVADVQEVMRRQKEVLASEDSMGSVEKLILVNDIVTSKTTLTRTMPDDMYGDFLEDLSLQDGYYYISIGNPGFRMPDGSVGFHHGTAAELDSGNARYFDPNIGEADQFGASELVPFVEHLVHSQYGLPRSRHTQVMAIRFT